MSILNNTNLLQDLLDTVNALPEAENLDSELSTQTTLISEQDAKIAELAEILSGKAGGSEPALQEKTVTPSTSKQTVTADSGYDGLSKVTVNAMSTATQATPSISVNSSGLITASATQSAGYVAAGTKSATKQLATQAAKTVTPSTSSQTAVSSGVYTTGAVTVGAIPSSYVKPTATKAATTYTPTTSNQTIAAGTYCSGAQTIKGDANLVAENIAEGISIFGVTGTHSGGGSGGGGSIETFAVEIMDSTIAQATENMSVEIYYTTIDGNNNIIHAAIQTEDWASWIASLTVIKNSIVLIKRTSANTRNEIEAIPMGSSLVLFASEEAVAIVITENNEWIDVYQ